MQREPLGVVAAMPQEIAPLLRRMKGMKREKVDGFQLYRFQTSGRDVVLIESGMGPKHAAAATRTLLGTAAPFTILNFGFGGGVLPGLGIGDLVLAERVLFLEHGGLTERPAPDGRLSARIAEACASAGIGLHRGTFVTAASIMNKKVVAGILGGRFVHPVLEMETAAVRQEAGRAGVPMVAIRGVSDAAEEELSFSLEEFCDAELRISPLRVFACIAKKPGIIPQLIRLAGNSKRAGENLALCVELALEALTTAV